MPNFSTTSRVALAEAALVLSTLLWGITFPLTRWLIDGRGLDPVMLATLKISLAALALVPVCLWRWRGLRRRARTGDAEAAAQCRVGGLFWIRVWINAFVVVAAFASQAIGMKYTTATNSAVITGFNIVLVPLLAPLFGRARPTRLVIGAVLLCFAGIALVANVQKMQAPNIGDLLSLFCAAAFAVHVIYVAIGTRDHDSILFSGAQAVAAAILLIIWVVAARLPFVPGDQPWGALLVLAIPCTALTGILMFWAQRHVSETHAAVIFSIEPIVGTTLGIALLGEPLAWNIAMGAALVVVGIVIARPKASAGRAAAI